MHITSNWRSNPNKEYHCEIKQNVVLDDKDISEKLNPMPEESTWDKVCKVKSISNTNLNEFEKNVKNSVNISLEECRKIIEEIPLNRYNISQYNNIAYYLQQNKYYEESIFLINEILDKHPNRVVAYLNLADNYWSLNKKNQAKSSYQKYISLMKFQSKDLSKIPQRVYERVK